MEATYPAGFSLHWVTDTLRINSGDNGVAFFAFTYGVMIDSKLLCNKMNYTTLLWTQCTGEGQLIAHGVVFKEENARINLKCGRIIKVQFIRII